jgi:hypothetical protein
MEMKSAFKKFGLRYYIDVTLIQFVVKSVVQIKVPFW